MSHDYFIMPNNQPEQSALIIVTLSNTSHEGWQEKAGLTRSFMDTNTGDIVQAPFHTTIHDTAPISLTVDELEEYLDKATDAYGDDFPDHMEMLYDLVATARAHEQELGYDLQVFIC